MIAKLKRPRLDPLLPPQVKKKHWNKSTYRTTVLQFKIATGQRPGKNKKDWQTWWEKADFFGLAPQRLGLGTAEKNGFMDDLAKTVSGFTDSLPAFRELLPERKSHSQENLVQDLLCKSYEAHNALADVLTLCQLVNKFLNVKLLQKHSFKVSWVASCQKLLKEKKLLVNTLQPLVRDK